MINSLSPSFTRVQEKFELFDQNPLAGYTYALGA